MISTGTAIVTAAATGGRLTVRYPGGDEDHSVLVNRAIAAAAVPGSAVLVEIANGRGVAVALLGTGTVTAAPSPLDDETVADSTRADVTGSDPVWPTSTGTYRGMWRPTSDMVQGDWTGRGRNWGAAYFGRGLRSLGTITAATVTMTRQSGGSFSAQTPTMLLLSGYSRPSGAPTIISTATGPSLPIGKARTWTIPDAWLTRLSAGSDCGGLGIGVSADSPYIVVGRPLVTAHWERTG